MTNAYETDWYRPNALDELHQRNWRSRLSQLKAELREEIQTTQRHSAEDASRATGLPKLARGDHSVLSSTNSPNNVKQ